MNRISKSRAKQLREYRLLRDRFLSEHPLCEARVSVGCHGARQPSEDVHHSGGRIGSKLNEVQYWISVCRECHIWIDLNPAKAREKGLLAPLGQFNSTEKTKHRRRE